MNAAFLCLQESTNTDGDTILYTECHLSPPSHSQKINFLAAASVGNMMRFLIRLATESDSYR